MPYREKTAWLSLIAMALTFGPYFAYVAISSPPDAVPNLQLLAVYAKAALAQVVLLGIGHLILRQRFPEDSRQPLDERDLQIANQGVRFAYFVLIAGMILVGGIMPFTRQGWAIVNAAFFMIAIAETVNNSVIVYCYRRQA